MRKLLFILFFLGSLVAHGQSTNILTINSTDIFDLQPLTGKSLRYLFDGDVNTKFQVNTEFISYYTYPTSSFIDLKGIYSNMKMDIWEGAQVGGSNVNLKFYNDSKTLIGTLNVAPDQYLAWVTISLTAYSNVRFIEYSIPSIGNLGVGIYEMKLYGDFVSSGTSLYSGASISSVTDPGVWANGINTLGNVTQYMYGSPSVIIPDKLSKRQRVYVESTRFNYIPDAYTGSLASSPLWLGRFGTDHINTALLDSARTGKMKVQFTPKVKGGSVKWLDATNGTNTANNTQYLDGLLPEHRKYLDTTNSDPYQSSSYSGLAAEMKALAALYGTNASATIGKTVLGGSSTKGQGGIDVLEIGNELAGEWETYGYMSPTEILAMMKAVYPAVKAADPNLKVSLAALPSMGIEYWKALFFINSWNYGRTSAFPADIVCFNEYFLNESSGLGFDASNTAITPEQYGLYSKLVNLKTIMNNIMPNITIYWTENGFASDASSPLNVVGVTGKSADRVAADMTLRTKAIVQANTNIISAYYYYALFNDGTGNFASMAATKDTFNLGGVYIGSMVYPVGYSLGNEIYAEQNYNWFSTIVDTTTSSCWVTVKGHTSNVNKKLYKIWKKSNDGSTVSNYVLSVPGIVSATQYTQDYTSFTPASTSLSVGTNSLTIPTVTEGMTWIEVTTLGVSNTQSGVSKPKGKKVKLATN